MSKRRIEEWKAIEQVSLTKAEEIQRKLGYAMAPIQTGLERLSRLIKELQEAGA